MTPLLCKVSKIPGHFWGREAFLSAPCLISLSAATERLHRSCLRSEVRWSPLGAAVNSCAFSTERVDWTRGQRQGTQPSILNTLLVNCLLKLLLWFDSNPVKSVAKLSLVHGPVKSKYFLSGQFQGQGWV